jgi:hypothetical protein
MPQLEEDKFLLKEVQCENCNRPMRLVDAFVVDRGLCCDACVKRLYDTKDK